MPTIKLTQPAVERLKPPKSGRIEYFDNQCPGFGVRVSETGRKTWIVLYRVGGKSVRETLGTTMTIPNVAEARDRARESLFKAGRDINPVEERRQQKRAAEMATKQAVEGRFEVVAERFLNERPLQRQKGWSRKYTQEVRRIFEHDVYPHWRDRPTREIAAADVKALIQSKAATRERPRKGVDGGAATQANRVLTRLRTFFSWALAEKIIAEDPTVGVRAFAQAERERERVLDKDEIVWFWRACEQEGAPFGAIFRLMLLTAQRETEVAGMQWTELDLDRRVWVIPSERTKLDRSHIVHLSELAAEVIAAVPRFGELVFPTRNGTPVSSFSKAKTRLDASMTNQLRKTGSDAEIGPWVLHDLRRSATTRMVEHLKVTPAVADKILNHDQVVRGVAKIYNRAALLNERKAALGAWGRYVETLITPAAANVVSLAAKSA
jgi:integrase